METSSTSAPSRFLDETYTEYVSITSGDDDFNYDGLQLSRAIAASMEEGSVEAETRTTKEIMTTLRHENLSPDFKDQVTITIQRKNIMSSTIRAVSRPSFTFFRRLLVNFSGEDAVDGGGPKREFFRLLMRSVKEIGLERHWFSHDISLLKDNKYALAGKLIAWSMLQGGPGPRCLSDEGYNILCEKPYSCDAAIKDVSDEQLKLILHNIQNCATEKDFAVVIEKHGDEISSLGFSRIYLSKFNEKDDIVFGLLRQYYVFRVHAVIDQFFSGMDCVAGVGVLVRKHLPMFAPYFSAKVDPFTLLQFKALCKIFWSPEDSNARAAEESTIYCWEAYLQDRAENPGVITLEDVLAFITGVDHIPPLGFSKTIDIHFFDYDLENNCKRRPWTSTCAISLHLPRGIANPDEFTQLLSECIMSSRGLDKL